MFDGDAAWPELGELWAWREETEATIVGVAPAYLMACRKAGVQIPRGRLRDARHRRLAAPGRGLRLRLRAARARRPADQRQRRDRRLQRDRLRLPDAAGRTAARSPGAAWASTPPRSTSTATRSSASSGELVIRQPMPSMPVTFWGDDGRREVPRRLLRRLPGRVAPRRLGAVLRGGHVHRHRPLGRDAQPRRCPHGDERALRGRRGHPGGRGQPRRAHRGRRGRRRAS